MALILDSGSANVSFTSESVDSLIKFKCEAFKRKEGINRESQVVDDRNKSS